MAVSFSVRFFLTYDHYIFIATKYDNVRSYNSIEFHDYLIQGVSLQNT